MATPITSIDSPNIIATSTTNVYNITGSAVNQADIDYLLAAKYSFTGSLIQADNTVGFDKGILQPPTGSIVYPDTSERDFDFFLNGVRIEDSQVVSFESNSTYTTQSTASFNLGFLIRDYDVVTAKGKFKI